MCTLILVLFLAALALIVPKQVDAFLGGVRHDGRIPWTTSTKHHNTRQPSTQVNMVFDFFRERTTEGLDQLSNIAGAAYKGNLGGGLREAAAYTRVTNEKFRVGLEKSRQRFMQNLEIIFTGSSEDMLEDLVDVLLQADLGMATAEEVVAEVKSLQESSQKRILSRDDLMSILRGTLVEALDTGKPQPVTFSTDEKVPTVLFIMGANGMGKTTTIGKLAHRLRTEGNQTVLMAACDTFRAGAVDQLVQWSERAGVDCFVPSETRNTPSAVVYGALDKAMSEKYDTVLVDTSGRLSNNEALTAELAKMKRVIKKRLSTEKDQEGKPIPNPLVPHETLLVIDAAQGRMALDSAEVWNRELNLTGLILTKLDGSARGGSVVAVSRELGLPVKLIGVGEGIEDLRDFEPSTFVDGLLGVGAAGGGKSANEGNELSSRLANMREERDSRQAIAETSKTPIMGNDDPFGTDQFELEGVTPLTPGAGAGRMMQEGGKKGKKKKKKKKKGRR